MAAANLQVSLEGADQINQYGNGLRIFLQAEY